MKESSDSGPSISASMPSPSSRSATPKRESSDSGSSISKTGYKFWVLAAILLLAFWSMLTGSVTLKWSSVTTNLHRFSDEPKLAVSGDIDVLEVEERERLVRKMWDLYSHGSTARLPRFWLEAFQAGYEHMVSDAPAVRDGAVSEIAKMSLLSPMHVMLRIQRRNRPVTSDLDGSNSAQHLRPRPVPSPARPAPPSTPSPISGHAQHLRPRPAVALVADSSGAGGDFPANVAGDGVAETKERREREWH